MRFNKAKRLPVLEILKLLQKLTKDNLSIMKYNNQIADRLSLNYDGSQQQIDMIKQCFNENHHLFQQNRGYLDLHTKLLSFIKSLDKDVKLNLHNKNNMNINNRGLNIGNKSKGRFDEYFIKTTEGQLNYDCNHPFYDNDIFRKKLIEHYSEIEEYEKCADLINKKE